VPDFIRQKYRSQNQSRVPSLRCRDSGPYYFPKRTLRTRCNRQPLCPKPARSARARGGLFNIVTQILSPVIGYHAPNASRKAPSSYLPYSTSTAGHGQRRVGSARYQSERLSGFPLKAVRLGGPCDQGSQSRDVKGVPLTMTK
jgi:hypothetical protein